MKPPASFWTPAEDNVLREYAGLGMTDQEISNLLPGRTISACSKRRKKLGIPSLRAEAAARRQGWVNNGPGVFWKPEEDAILRRVVAEGGRDQDIREALPHRSIKSINGRRMSLGVYLADRPRREEPVRQRAYKPRPQPSVKDASTWHLVDLIRSYGVQTLGEAKALYRKRNELDLPSERLMRVSTATEGPRAMSPIAWAVG